MQITLTEALKEIKILDSRIDKATKAKLIGCSKKNNVVVFPSSNKTKEEFSNEIKSEFQRITDLIERRALLKTKLMEANAKVEVSVSGAKMTIASAIERKNTIYFSQNLVKEMKQQLSQAFNETKRSEDAIQQRYDDTISRMMEGKDSKVNEKDFSVIRSSFEEQLGLELIDPLKLEEQINKLETEIEDFLGNVDTALSIANATNFIEL
jgi:hypothetical protein